MTGQATARVAQAHLDDKLRQAERHRRAHAEQLDRLSGRWIRFGARRSQTTITPPLAANKPAG